MVLSRGKSIDEVLDLRNNALNFLRLVLAAAVIISHSFPIGGFGMDPHWNSLKLGTAAVGGFFAISGFLIARSRERLSLGSFLFARALRILPGLWGCAIATAFLLAPLIGAYSGGGWTIEAAVSYSLHTMSFTSNGNVVGSVLRGNPLNAINGSLWTLRYEVACYVMLGLAGSIAVLWRRDILIGIFVLSEVLSVCLLAGSRGGHGLVYDMALLAPFFISGVVLYRFRDRVPTTPAMAVACALALVAACSCGLGESLTPLPMGYLMLWFGARLPPWAHRVGVPNDISYGMYVYAFPIQQILAAAGVQQDGHVVFALAGVAATVPVATASWFLVEKPAMRLRVIRVPGVEKTQQR